MSIHRLLREARLRGGPGPPLLRPLQGLGEELPVKASSRVGNSNSISNSTNNNNHTTNKKKTNNKNNNRGL